MSYFARMSKVNDIVNSVGRLTIRMHLDVGDTAISNACTKNMFPASWRDVLEELCAPLGIDTAAPEFKGLFNMKRAQSSEGAEVAAE